MAVNNRELIWSRLHFATRLLGLAGAVAALVAVVLADEKTFDGLKGHFAYQRLQAPAVPTEVVLLYAGAGLAALALLVELVALLRVTAGRRNALGLSAFVQVVLAAALLVGVNVWSFQHPTRVDLTRKEDFTLPEEVRAQLDKLKARGETTVVVYQCHKAFAGADKPDLYDSAAERKVVEKVSDLVALLRDFGSQLRVEVLDVQDKTYQERLERVTAGNPALRQAIDQAPENSLFIAGAGRIQQMSFNEFYQLDRVKSKQGRGNLVLLGQGEDGRGVHPFVRRILNLQQRRPRVGVLTIHELLTTEGTDDLFTLAGLRKALTVNGFDVKDVVLKKGWDRGGGGPQPAADTFEESKLERLEAELESVNEDIKDLDEESAANGRVLADLRVVKGEDTAAKLKALTAKYGRFFLGGKVTERGREDLRMQIERDVASIAEELAAKKKERDKLDAERATYDVDAVAESRRLADVKAKLAFTLADCDLVIVPRLTRQSASGQLIIPRLYKLSEEQVAALRDFVKAGKPLLACLGPVSEPPTVRLPPELGPAGPDGLENMLGQVGFHLGKHTVLFNADARAFVERRQDLLRQATPVEVPPLDFEGPVPANDPRLAEKAAAPGPEHTLRAALRVLAHSGGKGLELRFRFPRPVAFTGDAIKGGTFLVTATGWNEARPFPAGDWRPKYTPAKPDDPDNETLDAKRRGPFSVGAAAEVALPDGKPARLAVVGSGEAFNGRTLDPGRERLLLVTANWLLGRDDYLPTDQKPWQYPRLGLTPGEQGHDLWLWGTRVGLPVLFAFLGAVVLLFRRLR
ncbi:MAG: hypothetical protein ACRC33_02400 [Gemmataceae bacterium]